MTLQATVLRNVRKGQIAAKVLQVVCEKPAEAYAHAITKVINEQNGEKFTHNLEVGEVLALLTDDGALKALDPVVGPNSMEPRKMYEPTWKAGLYIGLLGVPVRKAVAA